MSTENQEAGPSTRLKFDRTINLGHLISIIAFMFMMFTQWSVMDKRVTVLEEFQSVQHDRDARQDANVKERAQEVKDAINDLKHSIEKLSDRLGQK